MAPLLVRSLLALVVGPGSLLVSAMEYVPDGDLAKMKIEDLLPIVREKFDEAVQASIASDEKKARTTARFAEFFGDDGSPSSPPWVQNLMNKFLVQEAGQTYQMTDFSDMYKLSMAGLFFEVQNAHENLQVTFSLNVRERSEVKLEDLFRAFLDDDPQTSPELEAIVLDFSKRVYELPHRPVNPKLMTDMLSALHPAVGTAIKPDIGSLYAPLLVGGADKQVFTEAARPTLTALIGYEDSDSCNFEKVAVDGASWLVTAMGKWPKNRQLKTFVLEAQGTWPAVTWMETSLMQITAQTLGKVLRLRRKWDSIDLFVFSILETLENIDDMMSEKDIPGVFPVFFFSGRRAPSPCVHLIQHVLLAAYLKAPTPYAATSSMFAYRVFLEEGLITKDGTWLEGVRIMRSDEIVLSRPTYGCILICPHTFQHRGSSEFVLRGDEQHQPLIRCTSSIPPRRHSPRTRPSSN